MASDWTAWWFRENETSKQKSQFRLCDCGCIETRYPSCKLSRQRRRGPSPKALGLLPERISPASAGESLSPQGLVRMFGLQN
jgi:hypothetical protein